MMANIISKVIARYILAHGKADKVEISISKVNDKMQDIHSFSVLKGVTCNPVAPCFKECYINSMQRYSSYDLAQRKNLIAIITNPTSVKTQLVKHIRNKCLTFRWNVSGDIFSIEYYKLIVDVCKECKGTKFWTYTKSYDIVRAGIDLYGIPSNLTIYKSFWGEFTDNGLLPELPTAYVKLDNGDNSLIPEKTHICNCKVGCADCGFCFDKKRNVVFDEH